MTNPASVPQRPDVGTQLVVHRGDVLSLRIAIVNSDRSVGCGEISVARAVARVEESNGETGKQRAGDEDGHEGAHGFHRVSLDRFVTPSNPILAGSTSCPTHLGIAHPLK